MAMQIKQGGKAASNFQCSMCGILFHKRTGNFFANHAETYRGSGYTALCKSCVNSLYDKYLVECGDSKAAIRQLCRKLDIYWNQKIYDGAVKASNGSGKPIVDEYITRTNVANYYGKCYDDTLREEGMLWSFSDWRERARSSENITLDENGELSRDIVRFWGSGLTEQKYRDLEERKRYWESQYDKDVFNDPGHLVLLRQICNLELEINSDIAAGRSIDKNVNALNSLVGSLGMKPARKKGADDDDKLLQPMGVWLDRYEHKRPIPEPDPEFKDVNGIIRYVIVWLFGHLCKMIGIKNSYCKMYEDEMERLRVERPEYDDDDEFLTDYFSEENIESDAEIDDSGGDEDDEV